MVALMEQFKSEGAGRDSEWARQRQWFIKAKNDHQRREDLEDKASNNATATGISEIVAATATQIKEFEIKLDSYDAATVTALMENQVLLDAVQARIDTLLAQAYVMEDGRRVFKTEDGTQVFDENGGIVRADELDADLIPTTAPTWEAYSAEVETAQGLTSERGDLLAYQEKLDVAREEIADGEISEAELEELDADLLDAMPSSVRGHVPGMKPVAAQTMLGFELTKQDLASNVKTSKVITTFAPAPM